MKILIYFSALIITINVLTVSVSGAESQTAAPTKKVGTFQRTYGTIFFSSFQENFYALVSQATVAAKASFAGEGLGFDYERTQGRLGYGGSIQVISGFVDFEVVQGLNYPRTAYLGVQIGPRLIYRFTKYFDTAVNFYWLNKSIKDISSTNSFGSAIDLRTRLSPRWSLLQSFGSYGSNNSLAFQIGARFLF